MGASRLQSAERETSESKADIEGGAERSLSTEPPDEDSQNGFHYLLVVVSPLWLRMQWKPEPYESTLLLVVVSPCGSECGGSLSLTSPHYWK